MATIHNSSDMRSTFTQHLIPFESYSQQFPDNSLSTIALCNLIYDRTVNSMCIRSGMHTMCSFYVMGIFLLIACSGLTETIRKYSDLALCKTFSFVMTELRRSGFFVKIETYPQFEQTLPMCLSNSCFQSHRNKNRTCLST